MGAPSRIPEESYEENHGIIRGKHTTTEWMRGSRI